MSVCIDKMSLEDTHQDNESCVTLVIQLGEIFTFF